MLAKSGQKKIKNKIGKERDGGQRWSGEIPGLARQEGKAQKEAGPDIGLITELLWCPPPHEANAKCRSLQNGCDFFFGSK